MKKVVRLQHAILPACAALALFAAAISACAQTASDDAKAVRNGHYTCLSGAQALVIGGATGAGGASTTTSIGRSTTTEGGVATPTVTAGGRYTGEMWVTQNSNYTGPTLQSSKGSFTLRGNQLIPKSGEFSEGGEYLYKVTYFPRLAFGQPTVHFELYDNGKFVTASNCAWDRAK
jgi:hypothetical protein